MGCRKKRIGTRGRATGAQGLGRVAQGRVCSALLGLQRCKRSHLEAPAVRHAALHCLRKPWNRNLDLTAVQENIAHILERGFHRSEDLFAKLDMVLSEARADDA